MNSEASGLRYVLDLLINCVSECCFYRGIYGSNCMLAGSTYVESWYSLPVIETNVR